MGKIQFFAHLVLFFLSSGLAQAQGITVSDDTGQTLQFAQPVQRIISLSPAITENLFAIGLGEHVVGVSSYSDYPPPAAKIEQVRGSVYVGVDECVWICDASVYVAFCCEMQHSVRIVPFENTSEFVNFCDICFFENVIGFVFDVF